MAMLDTDVQDLLHTHQSNSILLDVLHRRYPCGSRSRWRVSKATSNAAAQHLRDVWFGDNTDIRAEPLVSYFLRQYIEQMQGSSVMLRLLELHLELCASCTALATEARTAAQLDILASELERVAQERPSEDGGRVVLHRPPTGRRTLGAQLEDALAAFATGPFSSLALRARSRRWRPRQGRSEVSVVVPALCEGSEGGSENGIVLEDIAPSLGTAPPVRPAVDDDSKAPSASAHSRDEMIGAGLRMRRLADELRAEEVSATLDATVATELRATSALVSRELALGCVQFLEWQGFHPGATCRLYSLVDAPVRDSSFCHVRPLGKGGYGQVWCSIKRDSGAVFAVKRMHRKTIVAKKAERHVLDERDTLRAISSPFVCALHYAYGTAQELCLVMEWLQGGSLRYHLTRRRREVKAGKRPTPFSEDEVGEPRRAEHGPRCDLMIRHSTPR